MKYKYGRVALVVGASSGMGKACAAHLKELGYYVYGTSRRADYDDESYRNDIGFIKMIPMDVTKEETIKEAISYITEREGQINILLNCPGYALEGSIEDTLVEEAKQVFNTNFFGIMTVCRHVLPIMREQKNGLIVNISSVAGFISIPFQSMYSASKYALEAMTEALRMEVKPYNIKVSMIEPGDIRTNFTDSRKRAKLSSESTVYKERQQKAVNSMIKSELNGKGPEIVAKVFDKILNSKNPPIRKVVGIDYKLVLLLKRLLPSQMVESIVSKIY